MSTEHYHFNSTERPGSPSGKLRISKVTADSVTLDWLPPLDDGGSPLTAFIVEALEGTSNDWKTVAEVDPAASRQLVRNLTEGETYRFRISAQNAIGRSKPVEADSSVRPSRPLGEHDIIFFFYILIQFIHS